MLENTNTKQFYPGPILNDTLEISEFLFNTADQVKLKYSKLDEQGVLHDVDLVFIEDYEVIKEEALTCEDESETPSHAHIIEMNLTASTGQIILKEHINVLAGEKLTAYRESALIQDKQYPRVGAFPAATHEGALDYLTMQNQEQQDELNRALKVPISTQNFEGSMPIPVPGRALKINQDGSGFEMSEFDPDTALLTTEEFKTQAQQAASEATKAATTATQQTNIVVNKVAAAEDMLEDFNTELSKFNYLFVMPIGTIGFSPFPIDETKGLQRILNGQIIIQEQFTGFVKWLKDNIELYPQMACTEAEWQTAVTMSINGTCDKFVIDDEAGTIRLPKYPEYCNKEYEIGKPTTTLSMGAVSIKGNGLGLGLTNGTQNGTMVSSSVYEASGLAQTAVYGKAVGTAYDATKSGGFSSTEVVMGVTTNASKSGLTGSVSGTATTNLSVTETMQKGYWFIQVATGAEETVDVTREIELNNPFFFGYYQYFEVAPNNISWLKSQGQWNSKAIYTDYYDWILTNANNGVANFKLSTDTYDDYCWVVNIADETFRLPIKTKNAPFTVNGTADVSVYGNGTNPRFYEAGSGEYTYPAQIGVTSYNQSDGSSGAWLYEYGKEKTSFKFSSNPSETGLIGKATISTSENTNVSLYFYVGETTQNANLVNVGRIEEVVVGKVNRTGDTMTGQLTVMQNGNATIATKCSDIAYTDTPTTSAGFGQFAVTDKNGDWIALYGAEMYNDGRNLAKMQVRANDGSHARIQIWADANNVFYCNFPKCTTKATTTSSASSNLVAVVVQNYVSGTSWYRVWSDGWIEQGGALHSLVDTTSGVKTVNYLKSFSNANYTFVVNVGDNTSENMSYYRHPYKKTNTGFTYNKMNTGIGNWYACGY